MFTTSVFLWHFSLTLRPEYDIFQYFNFCIVLFGGSLTYHVLTKIIDTPYQESSAHLWKKIIVGMLHVLPGYVAMGGLLWWAEASTGITRHFLASTGFFIGMMWAYKRLVVLNEAA